MLAIGALGYFLGFIALFIIQFVAHTILIKKNDHYPRVLNIQRIKEACRLDKYPRFAGLAYVIVLPPFLAVIALRSEGKISPERERIVLALIVAAATIFWMCIASGLNKLLAKFLLG